MNFLLEISHNIYALYALLFLWSFWDAWIISNFFIHGEIFFLAAGYGIAESTLNPYISMIMLILWAMLWDHLSYFFWNKYGKKIFKKDARFLNLKNLKKWEIFFKKYGEKTVLLSRLLGPISWIVPSLAAMFWVQYKHFAIYNFFGIVLWISQFVFYWYILSIWADYFWISIVINGVLLLFTIIMGLYLWKNFKLIPKWTPKKYLVASGILIKTFFIYIAVFMWILTIYFFYLYPKSAELYPENSKISHIEEYLTTSPQFIYSDKIISAYYNPINLVFVTDQNIQDVFTNINWVENKSFASDNISLKEYFSLLQKWQPPISDFYHNNYVQNYQFQNNSGGNIYREHIRLWLIGKDENNKNIYVSSVSKDDWIAIMLNNGLPVLAHDIEYNIDESREDLLWEIDKKYDIKIKDFQSKKYSWSAFETDGIIKIIEI